MDKNRFYLIISLGIIFIIFLFNQYQKTKQTVILENNNFQKISQKVKTILYLQNIYQKNPKIFLHSLKKCKIKKANNYKISCNNLSKRDFKSISNKIFNSSFNIKKFTIKNEKTFSIYMEISK